MLLSIYMLSQKSRCLPGMVLLEQWPGSPCVIAVMTRETLVMTVDWIHRLNMEFILAPCVQLYSLAETPQPTPPPPIPQHLGFSTRALLVSQDRRHLFVTPWLYTFSSRKLLFTIMGNGRPFYERSGILVNKLTLQIYPFKTRKLSKFTRYKFIDFKFFFQYPDRSKLHTVKATSGVHRKRWVQHAVDPVLTSRATYCSSTFYYGGRPVMNPGTWPL
jgi:hypothetical protein